LVTLNVTILRHDERKEGSMDERLTAMRRRRWSQTAGTRVSSPNEARTLIEQLGIITHFPASPEFPNLYHAFMGDPDAAMDPKHDSPAGEVYTWRWHLGRLRAGFYTAIVRKRPTWVSWDLLPAVLRLRGELRTPDELFDVGVISAGAYRVARALEAAGEALSTARLRAEAGFPTGREQRAAYQKAVEELDSRLMLTKEFSADDDGMHHALVMDRYRDQLNKAERLTPEEAFDRFLAAYLPGAAYGLPVPLARHLGVEETQLRAALERMAGSGAVRGEGEGKNRIYVWIDDS
jgi:hypothetical protein